MITKELLEQIVHVMKECGIDYDTARRICYMLCNMSSKTCLE